MTKVIVNSGICGFSVTIAAEKETGQEDPFVFRYGM